MGFDSFYMKIIGGKAYQEGEKLMYNLETSDKMNSFGVYPQSRPSGHFYQCSRRIDEMHLIKSTPDTSPGVWSPSLRAEPLVSDSWASYGPDVQESHKTQQEQTLSPTQSVGKKTKTCSPDLPFPGSAPVPNSQRLCLPASHMPKQQRGMGNARLWSDYNTLSLPLLPPPPPTVPLLHSGPFHKLQSFRINLPQGLQGISALELGAPHPPPAPLTSVLRGCFSLLLFPLFSQPLLCFWPFPRSFST